MTDNNGHARTTVEHIGEHLQIADSAAVHAGSHRAELGNGSLFDVFYVEGGYRSQFHGQSMDRYLKAHLGFLESISHSLVAIAGALLKEALDADD